MSAAAAPWSGGLVGRPEATTPTGRPSNARRSGGDDAGPRAMEPGSPGADRGLGGPSARSPPLRDRVSLDAAHLPSLVPPDGSWISRREDAAAAAAPAGPEPPGPSPAATPARVKRGPLDRVSAGAGDSPAAVGSGEISGFGSPVVTGAEAFPAAASPPHGDASGLWVSSPHRDPTSGAPPPGTPPPPDRPFIDRPGGRSGRLERASPPPGAAPATPPRRRSHHRGSAASGLFASPPGNPGGAGAAPRARSRPSGDEDGPGLGAHLGLAGAARAGVLAALAALGLEPEDLQPVEVAATEMALTEAARSEAGRSYGDRTSAARTSGRSVFGGGGGHGGAHRSLWTSAHGVGASRGSPTLVEGPGTRGSPGMTPTEAGSDLSGPGGVGVGDDNPARALHFENSDAPRRLTGSQGADFPGDSHGSPGAKLRSGSQVVSRTSPSPGPRRALTIAVPRGEANVDDDDDDDDGAFTPSPMRSPSEQERAAGTVQEQSLAVGPQTRPGTPTEGEGEDESGPHIAGSALSASPLARSSGPVLRPVRWTAQDTAAASSPGSSYVSRGSLGSGTWQVGHYVLGSGRPSLRRSARPEPALPRRHGVSTRSDRSPGGATSLGQAALLEMASRRAVETRGAARRRNQAPGVSRDGRPLEASAPGRRPARGRSDTGGGLVVEPPTRIQRLIQALASPGSGAGAPGRPSTPSGDHEGGSPLRAPSPYGGSRPSRSRRDDETGDDGGGRFRTATSARRSGVLWGSRTTEGDSLPGARPAGNSSNLPSWREGDGYVERGETADPDRGPEAQSSRQNAVSTVSTAGVRVRLDRDFPGDGDPDEDQPNDEQRPLWSMSIMEAEDAPSTQAPAASNAAPTTAQAGGRRVSADGPSRASDGCNTKSSRPSQLRQPSSQDPGGSSLGRSATGRHGDRKDHLVASPARDSNRISGRTSGRPSRGRSSVSEHGSATPKQGPLSLVGGGPHGSPMGRKSSHGAIQDGGATGLLRAPSFGRTRGGSRVVPDDEVGSAQGAGPREGREGAAKAGRGAVSPELDGSSAKGSGSDPLGGSLPLPFRAAGEHLDSEALETPRLGESATLPVGKTNARENPSGKVEQRRSVHREGAGSNEKGNVSLGGRRKSSRLLGRLRSALTRMSIADSVPGSHDATTSSAGSVARGRILSGGGESAASSGHQPVFGNVRDSADSVAWPEPSLAEGSRDSSTRGRQRPAPIASASRKVVEGEVDTFSQSSSLLPGSIARGLFARAMTNVGTGSTARTGAGSGDGGAGQSGVATRNREDSAAGTTSAASSGRAPSLGAAARQAAGLGSSDRVSSTDSPPGSGSRRGGEGPPPKGAAGRRNTHSSEDVVRPDRPNKVSSMPAVAPPMTSAMSGQGGSQRRLRVPLLLRRLRNVRSEERQRQRRKSSRTGAADVLDQDEGAATSGPSGTVQPGAVRRASIRRGMGALGRALTLNRSAASKDSSSLRVTPSPKPPQVVPAAAASNDGDDADADAGAHGLGSATRLPERQPMRRASRRAGGTVLSEGRGPGRESSVRSRFASGSMTGNPVEEERMTGRGSPPPVPSGDGEADGRQEGVR